MNKILHNIFLPLAILTCFCFFISQGLMAATRTWDGGGGDNNWSTAANWSNDTAPVAGDDVVFNATSGKNCTIDGNVSIASLSIDATYTGVVSAGSNTITLTRDLTIDEAGDFSAGTSTIELNSNAIIYINCAATLGTLHINMAGSFDCNITGVLNVADLIINNVGRLLNGSIQVSGDITSNLSNIGHNTNIIANGTGNQTLSGTGALHYLEVNTTGGNLQISSDFTLSNKNVTVNLSGSGRIECLSGAKLIIADGATINMSGSVDNLEVNQSVDQDVSFSQSLKVTNLTITSVGRLLNGSIQVSGDITSNESNIGHNCNIIANGTGNQMLSGTGALHYLEVNTTGGNLQISSDFTLSNKNATVNLSGSGRIECLSGAKLIIADGATINMSGSVDNLEINQSSAQDVSVSQSLQVTNLTITNIYRFLNNPILVSGNITATDASVESAAFFLRLAGSTTNSFTGAGGGSYPPLQILKDNATNTAQLLSSETFSGVTVMEGIFDIGANTATANTTVESGGTLMGTGNITGTLNVQSGGTLAPGGSVGTINTTGNVTLSGTTEIEVDNGTSFDVVNSTNSSSLSFSSTPIIDFIFAGVATDYNNGDQFQVFTGFGSYPAMGASITINANLGIVMTYNGGGVFEITSGAAPPFQAFKTTWTTTTANESITIPTTTGTYDYTVVWGDGNTTMNETGDATHTYTTAGTYTVEITGTFPRIFFNNTAADKLKIQSIEAWGDVVWSSMSGAFNGCSNLIYNATDLPNLSAVTDLSFMFANNSSFTGNSSLNSWDVSNVTNMAELFKATSFNQNISSWTVSNVTNMQGIFLQCSNFNQDISGWNVANVTNMAAMFQACPNFNQDISGWNVSNVQNMSSMFAAANAFAQDITGWTTTSLTNTSYMFSQNTTFNQNISGWNVSNVTNMVQMFFGSPFNQDISSWDVSSVTNMTNMFFNTPFNQNIGGWNVSSVMDMTSLFRSTPFNQDISSWDVSSVTNMFWMFSDNTAFNQNISGWNVSNVTNMSGTFRNASAFNQNLSSWNVTNVTNMTNMLDNCGMSSTNYDNTLVGWEAQAVQNSVTLGAAGLEYCTGGQAARQALIDDHTWTFSGDSPCPALPTELTAFSAAVINNNHVKLDWLTASELNNAGFEIKHSSDNRLWSTIGFVAGEGTTFEKQSYSFLHENPERGVNYYRLKQVDYDGGFEFSDVVSVQLSDVSGQLTISPNPVYNNEVNLFFPEVDDENTTLEIFNTVGKLVQTEQLYSNQATVPVNGLPKGVYLFSVVSNNRKFVQRVVVH